MIRRVVPEDYGEPGAIRAAYLFMRDQPLVYLRGGEVVVTPGVCGADIAWMKGREILPYSDNVVTINKRGGEVIIEWRGDDQVRRGVLRNALALAKDMHRAHADLYGLDGRSLHRYSCVGEAMNDGAHLAVWSDDGSAFSLYELGEREGHYSVKETMVVQGNGLVRLDYAAEHVDGDQFDVSALMRERNAFARYSFEYDGGLVAPLGWRLMDYVR